MFLSSYNGAANAQALQDKFFEELLRDCLGYAGAVIIRRILGIAHVIDYESIKDADARCVAFLISSTHAKCAQAG